MSRSNDIANITSSVLDGVTATEVGLGNVTNESKATMFASPTFTGTTNISSGATFPANPTITLGSNATFPDEIIQSQTIIKYTLSSNDTYAHANNAVRIVTRKSNSDANVEEISVNAGFTYIYEYTGFAQSYGGATIQRNINIYLFDDDTSRTWGGATVNNQIARITVGRERNESDSAFNTTSGAFHITGASYYASDDLRYIYLATGSSSSQNTVNFHQNSGFPLYFKITKIKGNILTTRT